MPPVYREARSTARGRHLVAAAPLQPGDVVLSQEPYAWVLYDDQSALMCDWTCRPAEALSRCSSCKIVRYSTKAAQRAAWAAGHKQECRALAAAPRVPPASVRLAARALWRASREANAGATEDLAVAAASPARRLPGGTWAEVEALQHHWEALDDDRKTLFAQMAVLTRQYMYGEAAGDPTAGAPARSIAQLLARFACNNHTVCDGELRAIGVGLYPTGALVNHSRDFNAVQSFDGAVIRFAAVRPITAGEEVNISYLDLKCSRPERRAFLLRHYLFDIDAGAPLPPPPAWQEAHLDGARCVWRPAEPPGPLDPADRHLTALSDQGGHMLAAQENVAQPAAAGFPGLDSIAEAGRGGHGSSSSSARQAGGGISISFWGPGLCAPHDGGAKHPSSLASAAAKAAVQAFEALHQAERLQASGDAPAAADTVQVHAIGSKGEGDAVIDTCGSVGSADSLCTVSLGWTATFSFTQMARLEMCGAAQGAPPVGEEASGAAEVAGCTRAIRCGCGRPLARSTGVCAGAAAHVRPGVPPRKGNSPEVGLLWATIAKVAALLEEDAVAASAAEAAARILYACSGSASPAAAEMRQLRQDIGAQMRVLHDL